MRHEKTSVVMRAMIRQRLWTVVMNRPGPLDA
jgi:hypothetical protein